MKRGQTSTEYIIIVAVVIVIAVVVSSILGDFPGISGGTSKKIDDYKLTTSKVAVDDYGNVSGNTTVKIRNNHFETLVANIIEVNGKVCDDVDITLNPGQSTIIPCSDSVLVEGVNPEISIIWTDVVTDAIYIEGDFGDYRVIYHGNGNLEGTVPIDYNYYYSGESATVLGNTGNLEIVYSEFSWYEFMGWTPAPPPLGSGCTGAFNEGNAIQIYNSDTNLYACWEPRASGG